MPRTRAPDDARVSSCTLALWWLALLLLHVIAAAFFGFSALFYLQLKGTYLDSCLQFYGIGMPRKDYSTIALALALVALPHAVIILKMLAASLSSRSFAFTFGSRATSKTSRSAASGRQHNAKSKSGGSRKAGIRSSSHAVQSESKASTPRSLSGVRARLQLPMWALHWHHMLLDRNGLLGVDGQYFHVILFLRELVETSLQTNQAYRMSLFLPRMRLNRFYVVVLVLNCWLTPLIYLVCAKSETKKRLLCLVCDCALDLTASVIIPCAILASYIDAYDTDIGGFNILWWYDDVWFMHVDHEFQMLLVMSWRDLGTRLVFSLGMLVAMCDIKDLVDGVYFPARNQVHPTRPSIKSSAATATQDKPSASTGPTADALQDATSVNPGEERVATVSQRLRTASVKLVASKYGSCLSKAAHAGMFLWGLVILVFHGYAESHAALPQCLLQVRPWGRSAPACALVLLDCHASRIRGSEAQVHSEWSVLDEDMVLRTLVRHCSALEMPPVLQQFSHLKSIKIYNSTIADWSSHAALTSAHHPHMSSLFLIRVNMSNGELPQGLLAPDFPATVVDIELCVTNLRALPADLDAKWPAHVGLYIENSALTEVPAAALRLRPIYLSVYGNPIVEIMSELFEVEGMTFVHVGSTPITTLPATVASYSRTLTYVYITDTPVSYVPGWMDTLVALGTGQPGYPLYASGTPYCEQLQEVLNGSRLAFSTRNGEASTASPPSVFMNASTANHKLLTSSVSCNAGYAVPFFPLEFEDSMSSLGV